MEWRAPARSLALLGRRQVAVQRHDGDGFLPTLSPPSLMSLRAGDGSALPSPNGSTPCVATRGAHVFTACLRNARTVAHRVSTRVPRLTDPPLARLGERCIWASTLPSYTRDKFHLRFRPNFD
ncbi:MAG: hypothetical protein ACI9W2_003574 [Gammaproteobacteria bacterium]|jgi:hypothetical protein